MPKYQDESLVNDARRRIEQAAAALDKAIGYVPKANHASEAASQRTRDHITRALDFTGLEGDTRQRVDELLGQHETRPHFGVYTFADQDTPPEEGGTTPHDELVLGIIDP